MGLVQMKVKNIVTGCNKKQARCIALEQEARANKAELELLSTRKLATGYKLMYSISDKRLNETNEKLTEKTNAAKKAIEINIEVANEIKNLKKMIVSLEDQLKLKELSITLANEESQKLRDQVAKLQAALKQSDKDLALATRPLWKKVLRKC